MNRHLFFLFFVLTLESVKAQSIYFSFKDGTQATYNMSDVRNIAFAGDVMKLNKKDGTQLAWNISYVGNYLYEQVTAVGNSVSPNTAELLIFPNPASDKLTIRYLLPKSEEVGIGIYDLQGKIIKEWMATQKTAGSHELTWQTDGLPKGSYFLRFTTIKGSFSKMIVLE